jgi:hypothetical protein
MTVGECFRDLARHPHSLIVRRWNWKAAALSAIIRGSIFFFTNLASGLQAAYTALAVDVAFRVPLVGVYAALTQALASAEPPWLASTVVTLGLPLTAHAVEFAVHAAARTSRIEASVLSSMAFSALSAGFNLFAMRRGVLRVGAGARPLASDVRRLPRLIVEFVVAAPREAVRFVRRAGGW